MKMKKILPLVILVAVLLALIGAYTVALNMTKDDGEATEDETAAIVLSTHNADEVSAITYTVEDGEITLSRSDSGWIMPDDEKFPIDPLYVNKMANEATALTAVRSVSGDDLEAFGLDKPQLTVTLKYTDGTSDKFELGAESGFSGDTYLAFNGAVYTVKDTLTNVFDYTSDELILIEDSFPADITAENVVSVELTGENGETNTVSDDEGISEFFTTAKSAFAFKNYKGYGLDSAGLAEYGITGEGASVKIKYKSSADTASNSPQVDGTFTVNFGRDESGNVFYATPDGTMTFAMNAKEYNALMDYLSYNPTETEATEETD